jgi:hypothetical protein
MFASRFQRFAARAARQTAEAVKKPSALHLARATGLGIAAGAVVFNATTASNLSFWPFGSSGPVDYQAVYNAIAAK